MKRQIIFFILLPLLFAFVLSAFADQEPIRSVGNGSDQQSETKENPSSLSSAAGSFGSSIMEHNVKEKATAETSAPVRSSSEEEPIYSNFNSDPVSSHPDHYRVLSLNDDSEPVLIQRIRTHHWNNGKGAQPGTISVHEDDVKIGTWQAVGRSAFGVPNVYWDVLVDLIMYPGHEYFISVSDVDSMSYNEASGGCGMFELYGLDPAPEGYVPSTASPVPSQSSSTAPVLSGSALPASAGVGYTFKMGRYEQDGNVNNGPEAIEWRVLAVQNDRALVTGTNQLEIINWIDMNSQSSWETSKMRGWLNGEFYETSFTELERRNILLVANETSANPETGAKAENPTQDFIFLLSIDEAESYFRNDKDRICPMSQYIIDKITEAYGRYNPQIDLSWLLRSPGVDKGLRALVLNTKGEIDYRGTPCGIRCDTAFFGMRPAFWMKIDKPSCLSVKYIGGSCLAKVPTDNKCYKKGDKVTVLFEPVEYVQGLIFNGWDRDGDGIADHGYYYNSFTMPDRDVELYAICYQEYQEHYNNQYYGVTIEEVDPVYHNQQQYYNPYNDPTLNNDIYDPNTGWWFDPGSYYDYYDGVG